MCGITGVFHRDGAPVAPVRLKAMTDVIAHRGPDGEGQFIDDAVGLGHRRLSIIDLSPLGRQPMTTPGWALHAGIQWRDFQFPRASIRTRRARSLLRSAERDSEVLLHAFAEWGLGVLRRLNGMFAFAIWDRDKAIMTLARDRFGVKPLYWAEEGSCFLFGSEIKALLAHGQLNSAIDLDGLAEYLTFQNFFTSRTLFRGVQLLPAGLLYPIARRSAASEAGKVLGLSFRRTGEMPKSKTIILKSSIICFNRLSPASSISDVEIGSYLSGGVDSGSITALAGRQLPWIRTFTVGFDLNSASGVEMGYDERSAAEYMSYLFKTEHYEMVLKAGDMERILPKLAWHLEEPRVGQCYPNFYAARLASKFVKVVLSGAGGDELFAGYPWRYYPRSRER